MRRKTKVLIGLIALIAVVASSFIFAKKAPEPEFEEVAVTREDIEIKITATGGVQPQNRLEIKPPVAGRIERILYREGDLVRKGATLAWMSSSERVALIDVARSKGKDELARWEGMYRQTPIVAPMSGILIGRKVEPGQTLTTQDVALVMSNSLIVRADVDETDIAKIKVGQAASIVLDAYPNEVLTAKVDHIAFDAKTANNVTVYSVDLLPQRVPEFMRSGMSANVDFILDKKDDALVVRADAVRGKNGEGFVLVASNEKGERPKKVEVATGLTDGRVTEITQGLTEASVVLVPKFKLTRTGDKGSNPFMPFGGKKMGGGGRPSGPPPGGMR